MKHERKWNKKTVKALLRPGVMLLISFVVFVFSLSAYAWFYFAREIAALAEISDPTAIFINAGNQEDIRYLDLGGIDVENDDTYKDFVFCIRGNRVTGYKIQLAYTTNNQFDYEIYPASSASAPGDVPASPAGLVVYDVHDGSGTKYYYAPAGTAPLSGGFLNYDGSSGEKLAKNSDSYHNDTYTPAGGGSAYLNRHKYAIPLYWQTSGAIAPEADAHYDFCDYYILRVKWTNDNRNDKETDIVYIAAKNVST